MPVGAKHIGLSMALATLLAGCSPAPVAKGINDPFEARNRKAHDRAIKSDAKMLKPVATAYGKVTPDPLRKGVNNVSDTLGLPSDIINNVLQGRIDDAAYNVFRLTVNATLGVAGLFDVASAFGLEARDTDFGETLHVWGAPEGAYVVLPFIGPSTERDAVGMVVDMVLDPFGPAQSLERFSYALPLGVAAKLDSRYRYSGLIDPVLYESADSYALTRVTYLDNRRYELNRRNRDAADDGTTTGADTGAYDIYEDFYE